MVIIMKQRLLVTAIVTVVAFLLAFRPIRFGPFEDFRVEIMMRYRFTKPIPQIAKNKPMENIVKDTLEKSKVFLTEFEVAGEHLLIIKTEAQSQSEALKIEQKIDEAIVKRFPVAKLISSDRQAKGDKVLWKIWKFGIFKPAFNLKLGLDLQGGSRIVLQCRRLELTFELNKSAGDTEVERLSAEETITAKLQQNGLGNFDVKIDSTGKLIVIRCQAIGDEIENFSRTVGKTLKTLYGFAKELTERRRFYRVDDQTVPTVIEIIRRRVDKYGVAEPMIYRQGSDRIAVEMPGVRNPEEALRLIGEVGRLEFRKVPEKYEVTIQTVGNKEKVIFRMDGSEIPSYQVYAESPEVVSGEHLIPPSNVIIDPAAMNPQYAIQLMLKFNREGARKFAEFTRRNVGKHLAIWYDRECISAPVVQTPILNGEAYITGLNSREEAQLLKVILDAGALPVPVSVLWKQTVSPTLGIDTIYKSLRAGMTAAVLIVLFMISYYRLPGLLACLVLGLYALVVFSVMSLQVGQWRPVLTLPGIIGFIISLGMAVDANIIICERLKEEINTGKPLKTAIESAFDRAWAAIFDSQMTTLIAASVLYWLGTGPIKGFATTLTIGTIANLFTAVFVTRGLTELVSRSRLEKRLSLFLPQAVIDRLLKLPVRALK